MALQLQNLPSFRYKSSDLCHPALGRPFRWSVYCRPLSGGHIQAQFESRGANVKRRADQALLVSRAFPTVEVGSAPMVSKALEDWLATMSYLVERLHQIHDKRIRL